MTGYALDVYANSFWMFAADLNAEGSQRTQNYLDYAARTSLGYQTIWSATNDPTNRMKGTYPTNLKATVCQGFTNGATHFEIYAVDVPNMEPAIQEAIRIVLKRKGQEQNIRVNYDHARPRRLRMVSSSEPLVARAGSDRTALARRRPCRIAVGVVAGCIN